jgi:hypothetical protein
MNSFKLCSDRKIQIWTNCPIIISNRTNIINCHVFRIVYILLIFCAGKKLPTTIDVIIGLFPNHVID